MLSIPQWCDCCVRKCLIKRYCFRFQSHNGAIAAEKGWFYVAAVDGLSIPQWCDCCLNLTEGVRIGLSSFNPTMVRLLRDFA